MKVVLILLVITSSVCGSGDRGDGDVAVDVGKDSENRDALANAREQDEIDALFKDLEDEFTRLYANKNFKGTDEEKAKITNDVNNAKNNLKAEKAKGGSGLAAGLAVTTSVKDNIAKLKSGDVHQIMAGGLAIAISVAAVIPPPVGTALGLIGTLASTILSFFTPQKSGTQAQLEGFKNILLIENDNIIKQDLAGETNVIETELAVLAGVDRLTEDQINRRKIMTSTGDDVLGRLAARILSRATDGTSSSGDSTFRLGVAYAEFASYRDLALAKMVALLSNSGTTAQNIAKDYRAAMNKHRSDDYENDLALFYTNNYKYIDVLAHYHPPEHSDGSKFLTTFIKTTTLQSPPVLGSGSYVVRSVKWPSYFFGRDCSTSGGKTVQTNCWLVFKGGPPQGKNRITFRKQPNGYFRMQLSNFGIASDPWNHDTNDPWKHISAKTSHESYVQLMKRVDTNLGGDIVILKFDDQVTFSNRDTPTMYWNGRKSRHAVYFYTNKDGYSDGNKYKLLSCQGASRTDKCSDW